VPIINAFGGGPPLPRRFRLPGDAHPSAIATARNDNKNSNLLASTDLYAVGGSSLYRFAADAQRKGAVATLVTTNDFFFGTTILLAMTSNGVVTLWGKNASNQVYYLSCVSTQLAQPGSWSSPIPILTGIETISTYINRADGENTIFHPVVENCIN
jgi:hypothetical protein